MTLELHGVVAGYGGPPVLRALDLVVEEREFLSVLGSSGSGKTTLLRAVAGLHRLEGGRIALGGRDLEGVAPERRRVGLVPQEGALFGHLSVAANVAFGLRRRRRAAARARVTELLDMVDLAGAQDRMPHELSGGQRQRVALARALAPEPEVVLLDEPFASLDPALRSDVRAQVATVLRRSGATAVLITHDQDEALSVSDRVAVLHEGVIVQAGPPAELYATPATAWVATFVGDAALLPGTGDGDRVATALGTLPQLTGLGGALLAVVRPEQVRLVAGEGVTVESVEFLGHSALVHVVTAAGVRVTARVPASQSWKPTQQAQAIIDGPVHVVDEPPCR